MIRLLAYCVMAIVGLMLAGCDHTPDADSLHAQPESKPAMQPAICWIDDDFVVFNSNHEVSAKYSLLHDWCVAHGVRLDFALVPFSFPATSWMPSKRIAVMQQWRDEGFGFLMHPVHEQGGWYHVNAQHPHDATLVEQAIVDCKHAFELYGLEAPPILVWPGNSYLFEDNMALVHEHYECAITSSYNGINHLAHNDRYMLQRLSLEALKTGALTKSEMKKRIRKAVEAGDWVILGSHFYNIEINDVPDETSYSTANVFEILEYAHSLCPLRPTATVWHERKRLWDNK